MILNDFMKSLGQMDDKAFRGVLLRALGLTILLLVAMIWAFASLLGWLLPDSFSLPFIGEITFLDEIGSGIGIGAGLILSVFLMVPVAGLFLGLFVERIADAVEAKHYKSLPPTTPDGLGGQISESIRFVGVVVLANLLALILYLIFAPLAPFIFWALNGFLLGREYFQIVAMRRMKRAEAVALRRANGGQVFLAGLLMAIPLSVPLLNLLVPILGVATFTHLFHRLRLQSRELPVKAG